MKNINYKELVNLGQKLEEIKKDCVISINIESTGQWYNKVVNFSYNPKDKDGDNFWDYNFKAKLDSKLNSIEFFNGEPANIKYTIINN